MRLQVANKEHLNKGVLASAAYANMLQPLELSQGKAGRGARANNKGWRISSTWGHNRVL